MPDVPSPPPDTRSRYWWIPYLYLLRVQIVSAIVLLLGPFAALATPILRGLFDLDYGAWWRTAFGVALVTLASFSAAWTLLATAWVTIFNAPERFGTERVHSVRYPITWRNRLAFAALALPTILTTIGYTSYASRVPLWILLTGATLGVAGALGLSSAIRSVSDALGEAVHARVAHNPVLTFLRYTLRMANQPNIGEGFVDRATCELAPGHLLAWVVFVFTSTLYVAIGVGKYLRLGYETNVSTLASLLLLGIMLCWLFAGLSFFLDRYRVSAVAVVIAILVAIAALQLPGGEHVFRTWAAPYDPSPRADEVLTRGTRTPILIAATGGGIQAAAWTARVLTGIDSALPAELRDPYTHSIRLLSTVSGGGVGAMYFSERYKPAGFDRTRLEDVVAQAEASSLDEVAWGAAYPDAWATLFPPVRSYFGDRGQALETAWTRSLEVAQPISTWRSQVWSDLRPANIFNATLVDSGERLLMGTSKLGWEERDERGLRNFEQTYRERDMQIVTAARLAASFAYVSPAARTSERGEAAHVVDGGYYDDYGMATLIQWADEGLVGVGGKASFPRVLVVQIRSDPGAEADRPDRWHGPFFQLWAPAETLLNVRSTGQVSHNNEEFELLQKLWKERGVEVDNVVFRFCGEHPPLSWHLTGTEKQAIADEWKLRTTDGRELRAVADFLRGKPLSGTTPDKPYDVELGHCG